MFFSVGKLVSFQTEVNQCAALFGCHISLYWMSMWTLMLARCEIPVNVLLGHVVCDLNTAGKGRGERKSIPAFSLFSGVFGSYAWVLYLNLCGFALHQLLQLVTRI